MIEKYYRILLTAGGGGVGYRRRKRKPQKALTVRGSFPKGPEDPSGSPEIKSKENQRPTTGGVREAPKLLGVVVAEERNPKSQGGGHPVFRVFCGGGFGRPSDRLQKLFRRG